MKTRIARFFGIITTVSLLTFTLSCDNGELNDPDKNGVDTYVYKTVTIGTQTWMAENLRVTHYRNGDPIEKDSIYNNTVWNARTTGAYCEYGNYASEYGKMYNGYAVMDSRGLAPAGWHVATQSEWNTLIEFLGGTSVAGGAIKEAGTDHWRSPNTGATNSSNFNAMPGGNRQSSGMAGVGYGASWWTSTLFYEGSNVIFSVSNSSASIYTGGTVLSDGFYVRCVKD